MYSVEYTCTSSEIVVTTNIIITASPSIWMPTPSFDARVLEPGDVVQDGRTTASCSPPLVAASFRLAANARSDRRPAGAARVVDALHPLVERAAREHPRSAERGDADLRAALRNPLPEEEDDGEGDRRDERDQPGVVEEEHDSALQHVDVVEVGAVQVAVDEEHHREADSDLGRGDREHEQRERPGRRPCGGRAENATRLTLTAASISSTLISTSTLLRRVTTP